MKTILKYATAVTLTGALALAAATPSEARNGRNAALIGGLAAGAVVGAAVANSYNNGYYNGYYGSGYGYYAEPGYVYDPGYGPDYAYEPVYVDPAPRYYRYRNSENCNTSPASSRYGACN